MGYLTSTFISTQLFFPFMKIPFTPNGNFVHATRQLHLHTVVKTVTCRGKGRYNKG